MGFLFVKVIETKKVAVRNSFFVNYPFVRVIVGKEKKSTNFKPGVEWWDKIFKFPQVETGSHQQIFLQARDKSIHVFGSDWLGEIKIDLDSEGLLDGKVHQVWYKFGRGRKNHSRSPRGYIHVAFQYFHEYDHSSKRPFSVAPVEKVLTFDEWLAANNPNWSSDSSQWNPTWSSQHNEKSLRQSLPNQRVSGLTPDSDRKAPASTPSKDSINPSSPETSPPSTRARSNTVPADIRSPSVARRDFGNVNNTRSQGVLRESNSDSSSSYEEPRVGNLIDLSIFDSPKNKNSGRHTAVKVPLTPPVLRETTVVPNPNQPSPIDDQVQYIKQLSLQSSPEVVTPIGAYESTGHEHTFGDWYHHDFAKNAPGSINPFLDMHDNMAPARSTIS